MSEYSDLAKTVKIEQFDVEIRMTFTAKTRSMADAFYDDLLKQLSAGEMKLVLKGGRAITEELNGEA